MWVKVLAGAFTVGLVAASAQAVPVFSQNFSGALGALESTGGSFTINATGPSGGGIAGNRMGHAAGYASAEYSYYQITGLNLTAVGAPILLSFDYAGVFEQHFDRFNVLASTAPIAPPGGLLNPTGASNMQYVDQFDIHHPNLGQFAYDTSAATGGTSGVARFDLSAFAGSTVNLRFQFGSDESVEDAGFSMDNVLVDAIPEPTMLAPITALGSLALRRRRCV